MKSQYQSFIALFYSIDELYQHDKSDSVAQCAGELNPFLWAGIGSGDPAHFIEFRNAYEEQFGDKNISPDEGFAFAREYVSTLSEMFHAAHPDDEPIADLFAKHIDRELWLELWGKAEIAADQRLEEYPIEQDDE